MVCLGITSYKFILQTFHFLDEKNVLKISEPRHFGAKLRLYEPICGY